MAKMRLFARLTKVDEVKREVWGTATEEIPDRSREVFDYESSVPYFKAWSESISKATDGKSLGNVREMHQLNAVGKLVSLTCDDANKRIDIGAKIISDSTWEKITEGVLTGFSVGGSYLKKWKDAADKTLTRFTAEPAEISVVDLPCVPSATYEYVKSDGSVEFREFKGTDRDELQVLTEHIEGLVTEVQALKKASEGKTKRVAGEDLPSSAFAYVGDKSETATWKFPIHFSTPEKSKRHVQNALARLNQAKGIPDGAKEKVRSKITAAAKKYGIDVGDSEKSAQAELDTLAATLTETLEVHGLKKSMGSISTLVNIIQSMKWAMQDACYEAEYENNGEGDDRDAAISVELGAVIETMVSILKDMVDEETSELTATLKAADTRREEMAKDDLQIDDAASFYKKAASVYTKMAGLHKANSEGYVAVAKSVEATLSKSSEKLVGPIMVIVDFHKAAGTREAEMVTALEDLAKQCMSKEGDMEEAAKSADDKKADADKKKKMEDDEEAEKSKKAAAGTPVAGLSAVPAVNFEEIISKAFTTALATLPKALTLEEVTKAVTTIVDEKMEKAVVAAPAGFTLVPRPGETNNLSKSTSAEDLGI